MVTQTLLAADSTGFENFGSSHLAVLAVFVVGIVPAVWIGRRVRGTDDEVRRSRQLAIAICAVMIPLQLIDFLPGRYRLDTSLPLQLCDMAWMTGVVALWTRRRLPATLVYFWGLSLTTQALVTPWLAEDWPDPKFLLFWVMHLLIVWTAMYLTWGLGMRPDWKGYLQTIGITLLWMGTVYLINVALGTNYGFFNRKPAGGSVLDLLGPWPAYVFAEIGIVSVVWALMTIPWWLGDRRRSGTGAAPQEGATSGTMAG